MTTSLRLVILLTGTDAGASRWQLLLMLVEELRLVVLGGCFSEATEGQEAALEDADEDDTDTDDDEEEQEFDDAEEDDSIIPPLQLP